MQDDGNLVIYINQRYTNSIRTRPIPIWATLQGGKLSIPAPIADPNPPKPTALCPQNPNANGRLIFTNNSGGTLYGYVWVIYGNGITNNWCGAAAPIGTLNNGQSLPYQIPPKAFAQIKFFASVNCDDTYIRFDTNLQSYCNSTNAQLSIR